MLTEDGFNLLEFNTKSPQLHLLVDSAEEFEFTIAPPTTQVARAVELRCRVVREGGVYKLLCCQLRLVEVACGQACSTKIEFTRNAHGHELPLGVKDISLSIRYWTAYGNGVPEFEIVRNPITACERGVFSWSIAVD